MSSVVLSFCVWVGKFSTVLQNSSLEMIIFFHSNRSSYKVPRLVLPDEIFFSFGRSIGIEVNHALKFLQDVSCGGNLKQFLVVCL